MAARKPRTNKARMPVGVVPLAAACLAAAFIVAASMRSAATIYDDIIYPGCHPYDTACGLGELARIKSQILGDVWQRYQALANAMPQIALRPYGQGTYTDQECAVVNAANLRPTFDALLALESRIDRQYQIYRRWVTIPSNGFVEGPWQGPRSWEGDRHLSGLWHDFEATVIGTLNPIAALRASIQYAAADCMGRTPTVYTCTVDTSLAISADGFCSSFVERYSEYAYTVYIVGHDRDGSLRIKTPPSSWVHGRYNTCEILTRDAGAECQNWRRKNNR